MRVNISLSNSSSLSFLNMYAPPICSSLTDGTTDSFSPYILPSSRNIFILGTSIAITSSGNQEVLPTSSVRKYSTGSSLLTSSHSMTWESLSTLLLASGLSLSPPASQSFLNAFLSRLLFFLESNSILFPRQAGFRPGRSTLDQILYLF